MQLSDEKIKEIADNLSMGMICYIHKTTQEVTDIIDLDDPYADPECWQETIDYIEENESDLFRMRPMDSREAYEIMERFAFDEVEDKEIAKELQQAIEKRKPFRQFGHAVGYHEDVRQQWFKYKEEEYQKWVNGCLSVASFQA